MIRNPIQPEDKIRQVSSTNSFSTPRPLGVRGTGARRGGGGDSTCFRADGSHGNRLPRARHPPHRRNPARRSARFAFRLARPLSRPPLRGNTCPRAFTPYVKRGELCPPFSGGVLARAYAGPRLGPLALVPSETRWEGDPTGTHANVRDTQHCPAGTPPPRVHFHQSRGTMATCSVYLRLAGARLPPAPGAGCKAVLRPAVTVAN